MTPIVFPLLFYIVATASACSYKSVTSLVCYPIQIRPASLLNGTGSHLIMNTCDTCFLNSFWLMRSRMKYCSPYSHNTPYSSPTPSAPPLSLLCPSLPVPLPLQIWFRTEDREFAPRLKTAENANIQPNPGLILRAEPTVTNILKVLYRDFPVLM